MQQQSHAGRQDCELRADHELRDDELDAACGGNGDPFHVAIYLWYPYVHARVGGSEGGAFGLSRLKP
jgi:hypothetical protein